MESTSFFLVAHLILAILSEFYIFFVEHVASLFCMALNTLNTPSIFIFATPRLNKGGTTWAPTSYKWSYGTPGNGRKSLGKWGYFTPKSVELWAATYN